MSQPSIQEIDRLWDAASEMAIELIKKEARKILQADSDLNEFIMAMGCFYFLYKFESKYDMFAYTDEQVDELDEAGHEWYGAQDGILHDKFQPEFTKMVWQLDDKFNVTGYPVRFTATGKEIHNW